MGVFWKLTAGWPRHHLGVCGYCVLCGRGLKLREEGFHYRFSISNGDCPHWFRHSMSNLISTIDSPVRPASPNHGWSLATKIIAMTIFFFHFTKGQTVQDTFRFFAFKGGVARGSGIKACDRKRKR